MCVCVHMDGYDSFFLILNILNIYFLMYIIIKTFAIFILSQLKYVEYLCRKYVYFNIRNVLNLMSCWDPSDG